MWPYAGIAQLVERNLAKVEVESSRLFSRSKMPQREAKASLFVDQQVGDCGTHWRDSKAVMHRIANPISPVRLRVAPPVCMRVPAGLPGFSVLQFWHLLYKVGHSFSSLNVYQGTRVAVRSGGFARH